MKNGKNEIKMSFERFAQSFFVKQVKNVDNYFSSEKSLSSTRFHFSKWVGPGGARYQS